jgi:hypothetical protein
MLNQGKLVTQVLTYTQEDGYEPKEKSIPLSEGVPGLGMPITKAAANKMISDYIIENIDNQTQNLSIEFGKETLFQLLSQDRCESIKFYFCVNHEGKKSLVAIPMKSDRSTVVMYTIDGEEISGSEVGGGESIREYLQRAGNPLDPSKIPAPII